MGVKHRRSNPANARSLRALLIQIGVKPYRSRGNPELSLRALCLCSDRDTVIVLIFFKISRLIL